MVVAIFKLIRLGIFTVNHANYDDMQVRADVVTGEILSGMDFCGIQFEICKIKK